MPHDPVRDELTGDGAEDERGPRAGLEPDENLRRVAPEGSEKRSRLDVVVGLESSGRPETAVEIHADPFGPALDPSRSNRLTGNDEPIADADAARVERSGHPPKGPLEAEDGQRSTRGDEADQPDEARVTVARERDHEARDRDRAPHVPHDVRAAQEDRVDSLRNAHTS